MVIPCASPRRHCPRITTHLRHLVLTSILIILCLALASPCRSWNPPGGTGQWADIAHESGRYHDSAHVYIIERAIEILRNDGYENWAEVCLQELQALSNGAMWADRADVDLVLYWEYSVLWAFSWEGGSKRLCNLASLNHFYNPDTGVGLDLRAWQGLEKTANWGKVVCLLAGLGGLFDVSADVRPDFPAFGQAAVDLCRQKYDSAVSAYKANYNLSGAMFDLGWACHLVGDMGVVQHTYDSWATHEDYENFADGKGGDAQYHAGTAKDLYGQGLTARQIAVGCAQAVHSLQNFKWAEDANAVPGTFDDINRYITGHSGAVNHEAALKVGLPAAERHTAALLARYMADIGVPQQTPPLKGLVADNQKAPVPGAFVFYGPDLGAGVSPYFDYVRCDDKGRYSLHLQPNVQYVIRPAMPGYSFTGGAIFTGVGTPGGAGVSDQIIMESPVRYTHTGGMTSNILGLVLTRLPQEAQVGGIVAAQPPTQGLELAKIAPEILRGITQISPLPATTVGDLRPRLVIFQPPTAAIPADLVPATPEISPVLSRRLRDASLSVTQVYEGIAQWPQPSPGPVLYGNELDAVGGSSTGASEAYVQLQLNHLVALQAGKVVTSPQEIVQTIAAAQKQWQPGTCVPATVSQALAAQNVSSTVTAASPLVQSWTLIGQALPKLQMTGLNQQPKSVISIPYEGGNAFPSMGSLAANGLAPVPVPAGVQLQASIIPGPGYLGSIFAQPVGLTTDATGRAAFMVKPGTHAGKLRVVVKVISDPTVSILPQAAVEFVVHPQPAADTTTVQHPALASAPVYDPVDWGEPPQGWHKTIPQVQPPFVAGPQTPGVVVGGPGGTIPGGGPITPGGAPITPGGAPITPGGAPITPGGAPITPGAMQTVAAPLPGGPATTVDFEQPPGPAWEMGPTASVGPAQGGGNALLLSGPGHAFWIAPEAQVKDFVLAFRYLGGRTVGEVIFQAHGEPPQGGAYHLQLRPTEILLLRELAGQSTELQAVPATLQLGQWHTVAIQCLAGQITVSLGGQAVLAAQDNQPLPAGALGFGCIEGERCAYDDISVAGFGTAGQGTEAPGVPAVGIPVPGTPTAAPPIPGTPVPGGQIIPVAPIPKPGGQALTETFENQNPAGWELAEGAAVTRGDRGGMLGCSGHGHGFYVGRPLSDFALSFRYLHGQGTGHIVLRGSGEPPQNQEYSLLLTGSEITLGRRSAGQETPLQGGALALQPNSWHTVQIRLRAGQQAVMVDNAHVLGARDPQPLPPGAIGFGCLDGTGFGFDDVEITPG